MKKISRKKRSINMEKISMSKSDFDLVMTPLTEKEMENLSQRTGKSKEDIKKENQEIPTSKEELDKMYQELTDDSIFTKDYITEEEVNRYIDNQYLLSICNNLSYTREEIEKEVLKELRKKWKGEEIKR